MDRINNQKNSNRVLVFLIDNKVISDKFKNIIRRLTMKKMFYIVIIVYLCYFSIGTIIDFSMETDEITIDKTSIEIEKSYDMTNEDFIEHIENAASITKSDIIFLTVKQSNDSYSSVYYVTNNNEGFLHNLSEKKQEQFLQSGYLKTKTLFNDVHYFKFEDVKEFNLDRLNCYVTSNTGSEFITAMQNLGINISITNQVSITDHFIKIRNQIYPFCFILFAAISAIFSKRKETVIKRLNGFSGIHIVKDEFYATVKILLPIFVLVLIIFNLVHFIIFPNLFNEFFSYFLERILVVGLAIISLFLLISLLLLLPAKGVDLKGRSQNKQIFATAFVFKSIVVVATVINLTNTFINLSTTYNVNKTQQFITKTIEGYVNVPWNTSRVSISESEWDDYYERAIKFYEITVDKFNGVIIDTNNFEGTYSQPSLYEKYGQNWITINYNYLELNPIYGVDGVVITTENFSNQEDVFNLLVPKSMDNEIPDIIQKYIAWYKNNGLTEELINIVLYDDKKSDIYSFNSFIIEDNGRLQSPIIEIWNKKYLVSQVGNYFGRNYIIEAKLDELMPYLKETGLENVIINTPLVSDDFLQHLSNLKFGLITTLINIVINLVGLVALITYIAKVFCETNRKKIAVMRMNGFYFSEIYRKYLWLQILSNTILIVFSRIMFNINILIFIVLALIELILFLVVAKYYEGKKIIETIKEGD